MTGAIVWFTGLPASGKSTLAERTRAHLRSCGRAAVVLDGDAVRGALGEHLYGDGERDAFYDKLADLAALLAGQDVIALVAATAPRRAHRDRARATGSPFVEVWVRAEVAQCEQRDPKGLYARARRGEISSLPGIGTPYEAPEHPDVIADGGRDGAAVAAIARLLVEQPVLGRELVR